MDLKNAVNEKQLRTAKVREAINRMR